MNGNRTTRSQGVLLVILSGLLSLLMLTGVLLVWMTRVERGVTTASLDGIRPHLSARSGVEFAAARLRTEPEPGLPGIGDPADDWTYRDEWDVPLGKAVNPSYHAGEPWMDVLFNGRYDDGVDIWEDRNDNGTYDGWSGRLRGTYRSYGETFKLRIEGWEGKIYLNGGFLDGGDRDGDDVPDHRDTWVSREVDGYHPGGGDQPNTGFVEGAYDVGRGWNGQLTRMLDNLVEGLAPAVGLARDAASNPYVEAERRRLDPFAESPRSAHSVGTWLISRRPAGGFQNWQQVEQALVEGMGEAEPGTLELLELLPAVEEWMAFLRANTTLHSRPDRVIHPHNPFTTERFVTYPLTGVTIGLTRYQNHLRGFPPSRIRGLAGEPELEERAPIAVNLASRQVLIAALTDLAGFGMRTVEDRIPPSIAQKVAHRILEVRVGNEDADGDGRLGAGEDGNGNGVLDAPFRSWGQWEAFCDWMAAFSALDAYTNVPDGIPMEEFLEAMAEMAASTAPADIPLVWFPYEGGGHLSGFPLRRADLLKRHFNPNARMFGIPYDQNRMTFHRQGEETTGQGTRWEAAYKDGIFPYSTEWVFHPPTGFSIESLGELRDARGGVRTHRGVRGELQLFGIHRDGTQSDFTAERPVTAYASVPQRTEIPTHGGAMGLNGPGVGTSVVTYPEPHPFDRTRPSHRDGYIGLATVEEAADGTQTFLHHFDRGWEGDSVSGAPSPVRTPQNEGMPFDLRPAWDSEKPGLIYPDGGGVETDDGKEHWGAKPILPGAWDRIPAWRVDGNIPRSGRTALAAAWVKETVSPDSIRVFSMFRAEGGFSQSMLIGRKGREFGMLVESAPTPSYSGGLPAAEAGRERISRSPGGPDYTAAPFAGRWYLAAAYWRLGETNTHRDAVAWIGPDAHNQAGGEMKPHREANSLSAYGGRVYPLFSGDGAGWDGALFFLGDRRGSHPNGRFGTVSSQVIDEMAVYDVGEGIGGIDLAQEIVRRRYQEGRYYAWNDATFRSPRIDTGGGRIRRVYWTEISPIARLQPDLADAHLTVRILGIEQTPELDNGAGEPLDLDSAEGIRYEIRFVPTPDPQWTDAKRFEQPILQSPLLDDLTIVYELPAGSRLRTYEER